MISTEENPARKRLFFASTDEFIYDEEYYDEQLPEKKRRLTPEQVRLVKLNSSRNCVKENIVESLPFLLHDYNYHMA